MPIYSNSILSSNLSHFAAFPEVLFGFELVYSAMLLAWIMFRFRPFYDNQVLNLIDQDLFFAC